MTDLDASAVGEPPPPYMIFVLVFLFFVTGLLGFLICHLLKKNGYRCRTGDMEEEEEEEEKQGVNADDEDEENQDTVEQILKCIIENEANMEAFKEMLGNQNVCVRHDPRLLRKESLGGVPPHHHTVHSGSDLNACHLCVQGRSKKNRRRSRTPRTKQRPGEQTVFSVGRFRVIHTDKKTPGSPHPLADSGDQLDRSQESDEQKEGVAFRKEGGYNLRNMFKDVRPPAESTNGAPPSAGKRKKSVTIFGLRRGSDPAGVKMATLPGGEGGAGFSKFTIQPHPVVLEEVLQDSGLAVDAGVRLETGTKTGSKAEPATEARTSGSAPDSPSPQTQRQAHDSIPEGTTNAPPASVPSSLPIATAAAAVSGQMTEKDKEAEVNSPGPLQTSTPIAPGLGSIPGFTSRPSAPRPELSSSAGLLVTHTPPGPSSTSSPDPGFGASLGSISLGSSPLSSFSGKTPSPAFSLKTYTSPPVLTPSPKLPQSSRSTPSEVRKSASPSVLLTLTPSPKLSSVRMTPGQSPIPGKSPSPSLAHTPSPTLSPKLTATPTSQQPPPSSLATQTSSLESSPCLNVKSGSVTSVTSITLTEGNAAATQKLSSLPLSPASPLSPSSPLGSRMSSVTIVKASPDSKREFSVVTMLEQKETVEHGVESATVEVSPVSQGGDLSVSGVAQAERQGGETSRAGVGQDKLRSVGQKEEPSITVVGPTASQEKDDMVEMEDIRDCKVKQAEESEREEEDLEKTKAAQG